MRDVFPETSFKVGDQVRLTQDVRWPGVARATGRRRKKGDTLDLVPAGTIGTLAHELGMWVLRLRSIDVDPEWPCIIGFYSAKLPPWIAPVVPTSESADVKLLQEAMNI